MWEKTQLLVGVGRMQDHEAEETVALGKRSRSGNLDVETKRGGSSEVGKKNKFN